MEVLTIFTRNDVKITVWRSIPHAWLPFLYMVWCECLRCGDTEKLFVSESMDAAISNALFLKAVFDDMEVERECRPALPNPSAIQVYPN